MRALSRYFLQGENDQIGHAEFVLVCLQAHLLPPRSCSVQLWRLRLCHGRLPPLVHRRGRAWTVETLELRGEDRKE